MRTKTVEFQIPEGFVVPEGTEPGEEFDVVCSFRLKGNGTLCLTELGDVEMPGYENGSESLKYGQAKQMMTGNSPMPSEASMGGE